MWIFRGPTKSPLKILVNGIFSWGSLEDSSKDRNTLFVFRGLLKIVQTSKYHHQNQLIDVSLEEHWKKNCKNSGDLEDPLIFRGVKKGPLNPKSRKKCFSGIFRGHFVESPLSTVKLPFFVFFPEKKIFFVSAQELFFVSIKKVILRSINPFLFPAVGQK